VFDKGNMNPLAGIIPNDAVVYDPYLSDANDWYLFADPARVPAFAVGFLNGQEQPQVFLKNPEVRTALGGGGQDPYTFELDSIDFKVRMDFGVAAVDPRGAYRSVVAVAPRPSTIRRTRTCPGATTSRRRSRPASRARRPVRRGRRATPRR
jgi:hypothetical protein